MTVYIAASFGLLYREAKRMGNDDKCLRKMDKTLFILRSVTSR